MRKHSVPLDQASTSNLLQAYLGLEPTYGLPSETSNWSKIRKKHKVFQV